MKRKFLTVIGLLIMLSYCVFQCSCSGEVTAEETRDQPVFRFINGNRQITSDLVVSNGEILFIDQGSCLRFSKGSGIIVKIGGNLKVLGSSDAPVVFMGAESSGWIRSEKCSKGVEIHHAVFRSCGMKKVDKDGKVRSAIVFSDFGSVLISDVVFENCTAGSILCIQSSRCYVNEIAIANAVVDKIVLEFSGKAFLREDVQITNITLSGKVKSFDGAYTPEIFAPERSIQGLNTSKLETKVRLQCRELLGSKLDNVDIAVSIIRNCEFNGCNLAFGISLGSIFTNCGFSIFAYYGEDDEPFRLTGDGNVATTTQEILLGNLGCYYDRAVFYVRSNDEKFPEICKSKLPKRSVQKIGEDLYFVGFDF